MVRIPQIFCNAYYLGHVSVLYLQSNFLNMITKSKSIFFAVCLVVPTIFSCESNEIGNARVVVRLTDAPADYQEVNVDIQNIEVNVREDEAESGWTTLEGVNKGIYNLLELTNGLDTVLADTEIPAGYVSQIRLILGDNNTLLQDNQTLPLNTPSAQQSGLKVNLKTTLAPGITYEILLDFDAARSVVEAGKSGNFNLKPVVRAIAEAQDGAISGIILPAEAHAAVFALQGQDTLAGTFVNDAGIFLVRGLEPGVYDLGIEPAQGYQSQVIEGVQVLLGQVTEVGTVQLSQ